VILKIKKRFLKDLTTEELRAEELGLMISSMWMG
jgi:hypothetical protein